MILTKLPADRYQVVPVLNGRFLRDPSRFEPEVGQSPIAKGLTAIAAGQQAQVCLDRMLSHESSKVQDS